MSSPSSLSLQITFLETLTADLRLHAAARQQAISRKQDATWPAFLVSGLLTFSAWTYHWFT